MPRPAEIQHDDVLRVVCPPVCQGDAGADGCVIILKREDDNSRLVVRVVSHVYSPPSDIPYDGPPSDYPSEGGPSPTTSPESMPDSRLEFSDGHDPYISPSEHGTSCSG